MTKEKKIESGDTVIIGEPARGKVHWVVDWIGATEGQDPVVRLTSGQTGRRNWSSLSRLTLHRKTSRTK